MVVVLVIIIIVVLVVIIVMLVVIIVVLVGIIVVLVLNFCCCKIPTQIRWRPSRCSPWSHCKRVLRHFFEKMISNPALLGDMRASLCH